VFIGRRLPALLRGAGLTGVEVDADLRLWPPVNPYQSLLLKFIGIHRDQLIDNGLLAAGELDASVADLAAHLAHPDTYVIYTPMFQSWGRKPRA
jgi:hypothetical protein